MEILIRALQFVAALSLLVIIHEFGHFMFARIFGIRVEKFYLFFNPGFSLFKKKIGDTEYGIGWLPLGGYVKIAGMIDESMDTEQMAQPPKPDEFRSKPAWQRLLVMLGGVLMNLVLALCIYIGMSFAYPEQYLATEDIRYGWAFNETAQQYGFRNGDQIIAVAGKPVQRADSIIWEILLSSDRSVDIIRDGQRLTVNLPAENITQILTPDFMTIRIPFVVNETIEEGGAAKAGLMANDSLLGINGIPLTFFDQYSEKLAQFAGTTVEISLARDGNILQIPVEISEDGKMRVYPYSATRFFPVRERKLTAIESVPAGFRRTGTQLNNYVRQLKMIATPKTEAYKLVGGPIAIYHFFPAYWDWFHFWSVTALLSIVLAIINILPIPALDGGHVVFTLYEMITGRKPSEKFLTTAQLIGFVLLLTLMVIVFGSDIKRFFF